MNKLFSILLCGVTLLSFNACEQNGPSNNGDATKVDLNGYEAVDLGLPSGILWAKYNIGTTKPKGFGEYFAWGETRSKSKYSWITYKHCDGSEDTLTKYCTKSNKGKVDNKTVLEPSDDAARVIWGGDWNIPTKADFEELQTYCEWTWTSVNNVIGYEVEGPNGNSIFLPAAGYYENSTHNEDSYFGIIGWYWTSSLDEKNPQFARYVELFEDYYWEVGSVSRNLGLSIRPVCSPR